MRPIDADRLLTDRMKRTYYHLRNGDIAIPIIDIEHAPTIGGWISVKDRLPKSMVNKVLVWLEHDDLAGYIGFGHYEKYKGQEIWFDLEHSEAFEIHGYTVTHWLPLPEPPKED